MIVVTIVWAGNARVLRRRHDDLALRGVVPVVGPAALGPHVHDVVVVGVPPEAAQGYAGDHQGCEDERHRNQGDVVRLNAKGDLVAAVPRRQQGRADRDDVLLLPQAQLEQVGDARLEAVNGVRVHLEANVDVGVLLDVRLRRPRAAQPRVGRGRRRRRRRGTRGGRRVGPFYLENVSSSRGQGAARVPA